MTRRKAVVAMSGGVDSSVAAALMKEDGYDVVGIMLKLWEGEAANNESGCCSVDAAEDARRVAQVLDIPFYVFNFAERFRRTVIAEFLDGYRSGATPNPCVACNRSVKFSALMQRATAFGADFLVTGHHARIARGPQGSPQLVRAADPDKDQSYVLYMLTSNDLEKTEFPVGRYTKAQVREIARELGLRTADKAESQEICFVPEGNVHAFLDEMIPAGARPGEIRTTEGRVIGRHRGYAHYTVGQRRGLGVGLGYPLYVKQVLPDENAVVVADRSDLQVKALRLGDVSFTGETPQGAFDAEVVTRYRGAARSAVVHPDDEGWSVRFDEAAPAAAPGQAAVFYRGDVVLGGGTILSSDD